MSAPERISDNIGDNGDFIFNDKSYSILIILYKNNTLCISFNTLDKSKSHVLGQFPDDVQCIYYGLTDNVSSPTIFIRISDSIIRLFITILYSNKLFNYLFFSMLRYSVN